MPLRSFIVPEPPSEHLAALADDFEADELDETGTRPDVTSADQQSEDTLDSRSSTVRLDAYLAANLAGSSRGEVQRWIKSGFATVNGIGVRRPASALKPGDAVEIDMPEASASLPIPRPIPFGVAYEDEHIAVIDKPAGLTVHLGAGHEEDTLANGLVHRWPGMAAFGEMPGDPGRPGIVHRLDQDTSGLMVIAKSPDAYEVLGTMVRNRALHRVYTALVFGTVDPVEGIIDAPIGRDTRRPTRQALTGEGRPSRTRYLVLEQLGKTALLEVTLETGRMHQIRVHLAAIENPVAGDPTYGKPGFGLKRQFLHAARLSFAHPITEANIDTISPLPPELEHALRLARDTAP